MEALNLRREGNLPVEDSFLEVLILENGCAMPCDYLKFAGRIKFRYDGPREGYPMNKVTYLLGAGASCNALPMVGNFADRLSASNADVAYGTRGLPLPQEYVLWPRGPFAKELADGNEKDIQA